MDQKWYGICIHCGTLVSNWTFLFPVEFDSLHGIGQTWRKRHSQLDQVEFIETYGVSAMPDDLQNTVCQEDLQEARNFKWATVEAAECLGNFYL